MKSLILICALASLGPVALAQPAPTEIKDAQTIASKYVDAALLAEKTGDYDTAIDLYQKAYELTKHPRLLWNIAIAHRRGSIAAAASDPALAARHRDGAREYYRKFLDTKPAEDQELQARGWLAKLDQQWAEENPKEEAARRADEERKKEAAIKLEQARLTKERQLKEERDRIERERISAAVTKTATESQQGKARIVKIAGLSSMGAGVVAVGAGVFFGLKARRISNELESTDVFDQGKFNDGDTAQRFMAISYATGGTLLLGGGITYWIGRRIGNTAVERASVSVTSAQGGGSIVVFGSF
jgi:tetratricopeptide (TPR) repeat protein